MSKEAREKRVEVWICLVSYCAGCINADYSSILGLGEGKCTVGYTALHTRSRGFWTSCFHGEMYRMLKGQLDQPVASQ